MKCLTLKASYRDKTKIGLVNRDIAAAKITLERSRLRGQVVWTAWDNKRQAVRRTGLAIQEVGALFHRDGGAARKREAAGEREK